MKNLLIIFVCSLLFTSCKRNHYYCVCDGGGTVYSHDYGKQFATKESQLKEDCYSHKVVNSNSTCNLIGE
jgi:hypothetical protein